MLTTISREACRIRHLYAEMRWRRRASRSLFTVHLHHLAVRRRSSAPEQRSTQDVHQELIAEMASIVFLFPVRQRAVPARAWSSARPRRLFCAAFASLPPPVSQAARFPFMSDHQFANNLLQGEAVDRPGPIPEPFLSLDNIKWVFDNKIAPRTGVFGREVFLCSGCTDTRPKWLALARASTSHTSDEQRPV